MNTLLDKLIAESSGDSNIFIKWNVEIRDQILHLIEIHPDIINQEILAKKLKKKPSEVSRFLSGMQNFTLESLAKIANVLNFEDLIMTDLKAQEKYANMKPIILKIAKDIKIEAPGSVFVGSPELCSIDSKNTINVIE